MTNQTESLLRSILAELQAIHQALVKPDPPTPVELEQDLTRALGVGPDGAWNK
jgi:hypothetical protein